MAQREEIPFMRLLMSIIILFGVVSAVIFFTHPSQLFAIPKLLLIAIVFYYVIAELLFEWNYHKQAHIKFFISWGTLLFLFVLYSLMMNYLLDIPNAFYQNMGIARRGVLIALVLLPAGFTLTRLIHLKIYPLYKQSHDKYHQLLYYMFLYPFGAFLCYFFLTYLYIIFLLSTK